MVNITHKSSTLRKAVALGILKVSKQETIDAILNRQVPKGDVFELNLWIYRTGEVNKSESSEVVVLKELIEVINDDALFADEFPALKAFTNPSEFDDSEIVTAQNVPGDSADEKIMSLLEYTHKLQETQAEPLVEISGICLLFSGHLALGLPIISFMSACPTANVLAR